MKLAALVLAGLVVNAAGLAHRTAPKPDVPLQHADEHTLQNARGAQEQQHKTEADKVLDAGKEGLEKIWASAGQEGEAEAKAWLKAAGGAEEVLKKAKEGAKVEQESNKAKNAKLATCLANKRIVFIGPSTSKADYLTLAYFAEYGVWPTQDVISFGQGEWGPNPMNEASVSMSGFPLPPAVTMPVVKPGCQMPLPAGCETYYRYTNNLFNGHEACDCYDFGVWSSPADLYNSTENRVYINGNTMISYFQYFGDVVPPRGTFDISPLLAQPPQPIAQTCPVGQFPGKWAWSQTLPDFLRHVIRHSKPTHVVLSSSFWPITPTNKVFWDDVAAAGAESVMDSQGQVIWKTTPQRTHESTPYKYASPRIDMTTFAQKGWQVFPAGQIVEQLQGPWPNDAVFYDFAHLRPQPQCHVIQTFLASHVCPGTPLA